MPTNYPIPPPPKYDIDVSFQDISSSIKFIMMLAGSYKNQHIITHFNFSSLILESEAITPIDLVLQDNVVKLNYFGGDLALGYRWIKKPKIEFSPVIALKFISMKIGLTSTVLGDIPVEGARSNFWVDPVIGGDFTYRPATRLELTGYADVGPRLLNDVYTYQLLAGVNYLFTKTFLMTLAYRQYHAEFAANEAIFNGSLHGWLLRIGFQF